MDKAGNIEFFSETDFLPDLQAQEGLRQWISAEIKAQGYIPGKILYVFLSDEALWEMNVKFLDHDTYTDIITFDDTVGKKIRGEMYLSIDRIRENADLAGDPFHRELARVMIHGIWHMMGQGDKTETEAEMMRNLENESLSRLEFRGFQF